MKYVHGNSLEMSERGEVGGRREGRREEGSWKRGRTNFIFI